jgi:hypothetical protein
VVDGLGNRVCRFLAPVISFATLAYEANNPYENIRNPMTDDRYCNFRKALFFTNGLCPWLNNMETQILSVGIKKLSVFTFLETAI